MLDFSLVFLGWWLNMGEHRTYLDEAFNLGEALNLGDTRRLWVQIPPSSFQSLNS